MKTADDHHGKGAKALLAKIGIFAVAAVVIILVAASATAGGERAGDSGASFGGSETFFRQFVVSGGPIVWFVLLPMSVITLYLAIDLCFTIRRKKLLPDGVAAGIRKTAEKVGTVQMSVRIASAGDFVSKAISHVLIERHGQVEAGQVRRLAAESLQQQSLALLRKVEWCNIIGNVAPMVGLFGTVFGMINAFNVLGISGGQPRPDQLAAAISVALVTTFWGLLVAIPALTVNGIFRARTESLVSEAAIEVENLLRRLDFDRLGEKPKAVKLQDRIKISTAGEVRNISPKAKPVPIKSV